MIGGGERDPYNADSGHCGIAQVILFGKGKLWLVNNRIDLRTWNELYT